MAVKELSDGGPDGTRLGQSATDLISFHGKAVCDQAAAITLATNATAGTVRTAVRNVITALVEKGLVASGP
jgi:hypothetical protein